MNHTALDYYSGRLPNIHGYLQGDNYDGIMNAKGVMVIDAFTKKCCIANCHTLQMCLSMAKVAKREYTLKSKNGRLVNTMFESDRKII